MKNLVLVGLDKVRNTKAHLATNYWHKKYNYF